MQDLITYSIPEYEQLALRFATDEEYLRQIRARLDAARDSAPLFDSTRFTRDVERLYCELVSQ
jgi:predicted O-linked N-acetylglucosamine transferase (SPINDLY family)